VDTIQLPETQARNRARLFALLLGCVTVGLFGWMYLLWLRPLRQLVRQAESIADGALDTHVEVRRYDEIGLVARALERIRIRLIRNATGPSRPQPQPPRPPQPPPPPPPLRMTARR